MYQVVDLLLARGADVTVIDDNGQTALDLARAGSFDTVVSALARAADSKVKGPDTDPQPPNPGP
jgi:ankyrin repeat protein